MEQITRQINNNDLDTIPDNILSGDLIELISKYTQLTKRNRAKAAGFMQGLLVNQQEETGEIEAQRLRSALYVISTKA